MTFRISLISKRILPAAMLCSYMGFAGIHAYAQDHVPAGIGKGTTVVVIRTPKSIYAAVDSKLTYREYRDGQLTTTDALLCKMKLAGPWYSLVAGTVRGTNGYDAQDDIAQAYAPGRGIDEMLSALQTLVPQKLVPMFQTMRDINPENFDSNIADAELEVALMGMENNTPRVGIVEFHASDDSGQIGLTSKVSTCPGNCPNPVMGYFLGTHEAIDASIRNDNSVLSHPSEDGIDQLMRLEFSSRPDVVGGPVAMVRISASGSGVLREGACQAAGPESLANAPQNAPQPAVESPAQPQKSGKAKTWIKKHKGLIVGAATLAL